MIPEKVLSLIEMNCKGVVNHQQNYSSTEVLLAIYSLDLLAEVRRIAAGAKKRKKTRGTR